MDFSPSAAFCPKETCRHVSLAYGYFVKNHLEKKFCFKENFAFCFPDKQAGDENAPCP